MKVLVPLNPNNMVTGDISVLYVSELDQFVMAMLETNENLKVHGGKECMDKEEEHESRGNECFWKEFLNDVVDEEIDVLDVQEEDEEDVNVLIEQICCLVSRPK